MAQQEKRISFNVHESLMRGWKSFADTAITVLGADIQYIDKRGKLTPVGERSPALSGVIGYQLVWGYKDSNSIDNGKIELGLRLFPYLGEIHYVSSASENILKMNSINAVVGIKDNTMINIISKKGSNTSEARIGKNGISQFVYTHTRDNGTSSLVLSVSDAVVHYTSSHGEEFHLSHAEGVSVKNNAWYVGTDDGRTRARYTFGHNGIEEAHMSPFGEEIVREPYKEAFIAAAEIFR